MASARIMRDPRFPGMDCPDVDDSATWNAEIDVAATRLAPYLCPTPVVESTYLSKTLGRRVLLKLESMQPVGAFKVRPAFNSILAHLEHAKDAGVVTNSSGNFAQAVAYAASRLGVDSAIVMMRGASRFKRDRTSRFGGNVVLCEDSFNDRFETTQRVQRESGRLLVHPFNSVETIAGDGTLGLELLHQVEGAFDLFVPISGGGLISGIALAVKAARPECRVIGAQAAANPSTQRSLEAGRPVRLVPSKSLADALTVPEPGSNTFPIIRKHVESVELVDEESMKSTVRTLAVEDKLVVEAGAAVSVAAALAQPTADGNRPLVCVISGGNIDPATLTSILGNRL